MVDLVKMKGIVWTDEAMGADYEVVDIPEDLVDQANEYREKMLETIVDQDEDVMESTSKAKSRMRRPSRR